MSWGRSWGRLWGGGHEDGIPFEILSARASGSKTFTVTFSKAPLLLSPLNSGDSSRLTNWTLERVDKDQTLTILTVRPVSGDLLTIEFVIAQSWESKLAIYRITGNAALTTNTGSPNIVTPATADFNGAPATVPATETPRVLVDLYNPQTNPELLNGGLVVGNDGDYELESGLPMLKKLIQRRIFTAQGAFLHLADTNYGFGVQAKDFYREVDLREFRRRIKDEVSAEPEVVEAGVQVELFPDGRLVISIQARTNFGPLELELPVSGLGGVQF